MNSNEFREFGKTAIDFIANYLDTIRDRPVLPSVEPGYLHGLLPSEMPENSESWRKIMKDFENFIMPGITHWQSPNFHGFFPTPTCFPSVVGEMISAGLGVVGFSWICSPACTELEVIMMNWLGKFINLPESFLNCGPGNGGGVIQGSASESILVAILTAREQTVRRIKSQFPDMEEGVIRSKLVGYSSDQSNSCVEKGGILGAIPLRLLPTDENWVLRGETLQKAIDEDIARGLIPCVCISTMGTTSTCAFDDIPALGEICNKNNIWFHIDAAYAGSFFCLPEYQHAMKGIELADSFNYNLHKLMHVNFDCCAMWFQNCDSVVQSFTVDRIYLQHQFQGQSLAPDYRHWQISLGRRFRALKVWFTLRSYGKAKICEILRRRIQLAESLEQKLRTDPRFEVTYPAYMGLVIFRLAEGCEKTKILLEKLHERKNLYLTPTNCHGKFVIRFVIAGIDPQEGDIEFAWKEFQTVVNSIVTRDDQISMMETNIIEKKKGDEETAWMEISHDQNVEKIK
ncbi:3,4-dihydroxyphenylacetaldehyde synthase 2-like isoform X1 [Culicoides brevitarsis]|uniref:3,4-dihydroxyphenylacetaldehyde synthase 2-like isoform X1 n=1 Tax=Culicoides brevitarsis TaxID=469753 RepID=UPI00307CA255